MCSIPNYFPYLAIIGVLPWKNSRIDHDKAIFRYGMSPATQPPPASPKILPAFKLNHDHISEMI